MAFFIIDNLNKIQYKLDFILNIFRNTKFKPKIFYSVFKVS